MPCVRLPVSCLPVPSLVPDFYFTATVIPEGAEAIEGTPSPGGAVVFLIERGDILAREVIECFKEVGLGDIRPLNLLVKEGQGLGLGVEHLGGVVHLRPVGLLDLPGDVEIRLHCVRVFWGRCRPRFDLFGFECEAGGGGDDVNPDEVREHRIPFLVFIGGVAGEVVFAPIFSTGEASFPGTPGDEFLLHLIDDGPTFGPEVFQPLGDGFEREIVLVAIPVLLLGVNRFGNVDVPGVHCV